LAFAFGGSNPSPCTMESRAENALLLRARRQHISEASHTFANPIAKRVE
jgi:hypothetical protein